jgi:hypothetical protein
VTLADLYTPGTTEKFIYPQSNAVRREQVEVLIAGGGIAGSALFRYFSEAGKKTVLCNAERGSSWRCIGGGRPASAQDEADDRGGDASEQRNDISGCPAAGIAYPVLEVGGPSGIGHNG